MFQGFERAGNWTRRRNVGCWTSVCEISIGPEREPERTVSAMGMWGEDWS